MSAGSGSLVVVDDKELNGESLARRLQARAAP
jgi:hypothetical protein